MPVDEEPEIVCLCGSTRFADVYREANRRLTLEGKIVLTVGVFGHEEDGELSPATKADLDELHRRKIDLADRVHVLNVDGYVGESTRAEVAYAREQGIPVTWLEPGAAP